MNRFNKAICCLRGEIRQFCISCLTHRQFKKNGNIFLSRHGEIQISENGSITTGKHLTIENGTLVASRAKGNIIICDNVYINRNCQIVAHEEIRVGSNVTIGPNTCIYDHDHNIHNRGEFVSSPIIIGDGTWIGANVVILKGVHIGAHAVIGAGSIVLENIPDNSILIQKRQNTIINYEDES